MRSARSSSRCGCTARTREIRVAAHGGRLRCRDASSIRCTAHSQFMGGMIWGIGSALHEATEIDPRARPLHQRQHRRIPDSGERRHPRRSRSSWCPERDDKVNPLGIKGIGEIGIVGMNAAIANAVFHATGQRIRELADPDRRPALVQAGETS